MKQHPYYTSVLGAIMLYGVLGFFLAPYLLEKNLTETMQQEFGAKLHVEKIEVNPFALSLRINGLELDNPDDEPTIRIQEIFTNFQLSSIFRLALTFDEIRFSAPELFIVRNNAGDMDFDYLMKSTDDEAIAPEIAAQQKESSLFPVLVFNFTIEDFVINWSDHVPTEPVKTHFGPIDIGVKELNTLPNRSGQQTVVIATEKIGTLSWAGDLQLNPLRSSAHASLKGAQFSLVSAYIRHQTGLDIVDGSADLELDYEVYETEAGQIKVNVANFNLTFVDLAINSFADGTGFDFAGPDQQILKLAKIQLADGELHWPEQTVSLGLISIENPEILMSRDEKGEFNLEPRQTLAGQDTEGVSNAVVSEETVSDESDSGNQWRVSVANLAVNSLSLNLVDQSINPEAKLGITDFNLAISDISNLPGKRFPTTLNLQAMSGGKLSLKGDVSVLPEPQFDFDVALDALQLTAAQPYIRQQTNLKMDSGAINLNGHINGTAVEPLSFLGNLEIVDLALAESINDERLASWKSFRAEKIALSLGKRQLDISQFYFDQLYGDILIDRNGSLNIGQVAKSSTDTSAETAEITPKETDSEIAADGTNSDFKIQIGGIVLAEASADFADLSLPLPFAVKVESLNGKMSTISNQSNEPSEVSFEGKVDEFGLARISGIVTPLEPTKNTDLLVSFENINVPKFTPYMIPFAGREIVSGNLDLKLGYEVKDSQLVGENSIILRDFELGDEVPHPDAMDIPLGLAVALLKDASGKIDIDLPVRGNVDDPEFSYGGVIWGALGKLLVKVVLSPFALLGNLLGIEASELKSIKFLDGRSDLTPPEMQRTGKLAEALSLRPELLLVIGGVSDAVADDLALRTDQFDKNLELLITELTANSDPTIQFADLRRMALEQLTIRDTEQKLTELRIPFTTLVEVEGQAEPTVNFDSLAYANELRKQLIDRQAIDTNALDGLASSRADALKTALIAIDENLRERIVIGENTTVTRKDGEPIEMAVTLSSKTN